VIQANVAFQWLVGRPWFWVLCIGTLFGFPLGRSLLRPRPVSPVVRGQAPAFSLLRESGQPYGLGNLKGKVWVVSRFGADDAPQMKAMHHLERHMRKLAEAFMLVSVAAEPEHELPKLRAWAQAHQTNPRRWALVGGPPGEVAALRAALQIEASAAVPAPLVLVDAQGRIRGVYDAAGIPADFQETMERLMYDASLVVHDY
jgi:cytochrome oxidase Cu insertion factor (SCO1/SenC/PrrC family)